MRKTNHFKYLLVAFIVTTMMLVVVSCGDDEKTQITTISLDKNVISLVLNTSQTLTATIDPPGSDSNIVWTSSNPEIAAVVDGTVTATGLGKTVISAKFGNSAAFCDVFVTKVIVPVSAVSLNKSQLEMKIGDEEVLVAVLAPEDATNMKVQWSSSNEAVATVEDDGKVTALAAGEAIITVTTLDGNKTDQCTVIIYPTIELFTPSEDNIQLNPVAWDENLSFTWSDVAGVESYRIKISQSENFDEADVVYTASSAENNLDVSHFSLNEIIKVLPGNTVELFWTVESETAGINPLSAIGKLNLTSDKREYLRLEETSASGMQLQKLEGEYRYMLTTNGAATVNTTQLVTAHHSDSSVVSIMYKSNRDLTEATVRFMSGTTVRGTAQQAIPASAEWREWRLLQMKLPNDWGNAGDYLQLDFGDTAGYQIELNAITLTAITLADEKELYEPEMLSMEWFAGSRVVILESVENYIKFEVVAINPYGRTFPLSQELPAGAEVLSFEYKSNMPTESRFRIFFGPPESGARSLSLPPVPANTSGEWEEYTVDISTIRVNYPEWGKPGDRLRFDFGVESVGLIFELRNIHIKYKD